MADTPLTEIRLTEAISFGSDVSSRFDAEAGILKNPKILGKYSAGVNGIGIGKEYLPSAHLDCVRIFEGAQVYIDHPADEKHPDRKVRERFGRLHGLYTANGETFAKEFRFPPEHEYAKTFAWEVKNGASKLGFSINAKGSGRKAEDRILVEHIKHGFSVDLVDSPATALTLWEQTMNENILSDTGAGTGDSTGTVNADDYKNDLVNALTSLATALKDGGMTLEEVRKKAVGILQMIEEAEGKEPAKEETTETMAVEQLKSLNLPSLSGTILLLESTQKRRKNDERWAKATKILPKIALTEQFKKILTSVDDSMVDELIEDKRKSAGPISLPRDKVNVDLKEQQKSESVETDPELDEIGKLASLYMRDLSR